ncbi:FAD/NAD(P)-binding protein [uncultured Microbulbifer sp.]|uniref:FAD/NAD(P)-binding protein n=1 Tax=uncultured Microbulbifer sp. TaxID=348147 RepID=UPI0025D50863|nr:FAD/NAD(P)-binding protein [uncultured Microbulbifer sp.]
MTPEVFRVEQRREEFPGTFTLRIRGERAKNGSPAEFQPGQFNMLYAFGAGEIAISLSGSPRDRDGYVHTIRTHGFVSQALERLQAGDLLGVRGPFGCGWPLSAAKGKEVLIIAGGLGLAPLRPLIYNLLGDTQSVRNIRLFYGARRPDEMLYRDELAQWAGSMEIVQSVDHGDADWAGHIGVITGPLAGAELDPQNTVAFLCGPEVMMRFCIQTLTAKAVPESAIYLSMERNMKCATGHCGHCQWGPNFVCKDGPVFNFAGVQSWFNIRAL